VTTTAAGAPVATAVPPDGAAGAPATSGARRFLRPVGIFAASRVVVVVAMWLGTKLVPPLSMAGAASTWDGGWYLLVAGGGYPDAVPETGGSALAFFPLYPLLVRAVDTLPLLTPIGAAVVVSGIASLCAAVVIWVLGSELLGTEVADRAVTLFAFFPGSFVLSMVYAEGVMLLLSAGCLLALVRRRWLVAGVLAALATAARPNAVAVIGACGWAALTAIRTRGEWRSLVAPALAPLGIVAFLGYLWARTGEATAWFVAQRVGWEERVRPLAVVDDLRRAAREPLVDLNNTVVVVGAVLAVVGFVLLIRARVPGEVVVFAAIVLGLALVSETLGPRPRFLLTAFPVFYGVAAALRGAAATTVVAMSACTLGAFTLMSVTTLAVTP
jgi:hypothetical protein